MNDQLNRSKNKGMTNSKNHAFLNCPISPTGAVRGTPPTRGEAGGQFKKASWVHVLDALPLMLTLPCEIARVELQQFIVGQEAANADVADVSAVFKTSIEGFGAEFAELGGGHLGCGGVHLGLGFGCEQLTDKHPVNAIVEALQRNAGNAADNGAVFKWHAASSGPVLYVLASDALTNGCGHSRGAPTEKAKQSTCNSVAFVKTECDIAGKFFSPAANQCVFDARIPFVFVSGDAGRVAATGNQLPLSNDCRAFAHSEIVRDKLNTHARHTINMGCDAAYWVNRAAYLDVTVAEVADVEVFHLRLQLLSGFDGLGVLPFQNHQPRLGDAFAKSPIADDVLLDAQSLRQIANAFCLLNCNV